MGVITVLFAVVVVALSVTGLCLGVLAGRRPLRGSCGGCAGCRSACRQERP